jgi:GMP synthase-like glutamine amidotransferase
MRINIIQHVPFESGALIEEWALAGNHAITKTLLFDAPVMPLLQDFDMLVIMGGPMGAHDDDVHSWLSEEKKLIRSAMDDGKKVLGICLGAQIIAAVLGAMVFKNNEKEIGWFPVSRCTKTAMDLDLPEQMTVFHWHGDTFTLPEDSIHLFKSEGCANQGFLYGSNVLALQFHLEMNLESVHKIVFHCGDELVEGKHIQNADYIISNSIRFIEMNRAFLYTMLDHFIQW